MRTRLLVYEKAGSTQDLAKKIADQGEPEGTAVLALHQTTGRGSQGRTWTSPSGKALALSLVLRPTLEPGEAPLLGLLASIAVAETVEECIGRPAHLKWPNDVLVDGKKIAGILSEASVDSNALDYVILGVGLNINMESMDFPAEVRETATSLLLVTSQPWDVQETGQTLLDRFGALYDKVNDRGCTFIVDRWQTRWAHRGRLMTREQITGFAESIDQDGALLLRTSTGSLERIVSGDTHILEDEHGAPRLFEPPTGHGS